jgi:hypothetical protein
MKVYLVQKRYWQFDDQYFVLEDSIPLKAFESREDAEAFRLLQELNEQQEWEANYALFLGEEGPREHREYPLLEVIETELYG